jgi:hypothetical protein
MRATDISRTRIQDRLAEAFTRQADWRAQKAAEYPEDARNARSAERLTEVAAWIRELPDTDDRILVLDGLDHGPSDLYVFGDGARVLVERFGFHDEGVDFDGFLTRLLEAETATAAEFQADELGRE